MTCFAARLKQLRNQRGLTQTEVAAAIGVTRSVVSLYENEMRQPSPEIIIALARLYVWGDRIFEKCGIRRDEEGDGGKTLEIRGKRRLSARDGGANYQQS